MKLSGLWRNNYPMANLSSWRVGGPARVLFTPADIEDFQNFIQMKKDKFLMIGYGSNVLVRDGGIDKVVVRTAPGLCALRLEEEGLVYAQAGVSCSKLARFCVRNGLTGGEFFIGIPGSVGGALAMNAGCYGHETWEKVEKAKIFDEHGNCHEITPADAKIGYRDVSLKIPGACFSAAFFRFRVGNKSLSNKTMKELLNHRRETQPLGLRTAGSVFCNPPGGYAGQLIEQCGLKGMRIGDAEVSTKHANFIINHGNATAADIENLIEQVHDTVREKTGTDLCSEVRVIGKKNGDV